MVLPSVGVRCDRPIALVWCVTMKAITAVLMPAVLLSLLLPGRTASASQPCSPPAGHERLPGYPPPTTPPGRSRQNLPPHSPLRCHLSIDMMPPDDESRPRRIRCEEPVSITLPSAEPAKASFQVSQRSWLCIPAEPLFRSLCVLLI
jgi:hypothetical protein